MQARIKLTVARDPLTFERHADKIAVAPDQSATAHRAESIERNSEFGRHDVQAVQSKAGAMVGDITNATFVNAVLAREEHQYVAIDHCAADAAALCVASGFLKHRHAARLRH